MKTMLRIILILCMICLTVSAESFGNLKYESSMETVYAERFGIDYYEGGYKVITVSEGQTVLIVPEGAEVPSGIDPDTVVLQQPLSNMYIANTAGMCFFDRLDMLNTIRFSSQPAENWYCENAAKAMENGEMVFAGKYSEPDYELLLTSGCDLALENTMILHTPKVQEMLEMLGIPVFIDRSSYESNPLGKVEWIRVYGAMLNLEEKADAYFKTQCAEIENLTLESGERKTVAFFYVNDDSTVAVRGSGDYIAKMIDIAGGEYIFNDVQGVDENDPSITMSMEQFYSVAIEADYLIYNGTMQGITTVNDLLEKSALFADFRAVQNGNVWSTDRNLYQATDALGTVTADINRMLTGNDNTTFITHLK